MTDEPKGPRVQVLTSSRMPDPRDPDDVIHGKRFTDPKTGKPASIPDILVSMGLMRPEPESPGPTD